MSTSAEDLRRRLQAKKGGTDAESLRARLSGQKESSAGEAFYVSGFNQLVNNILAAPSATGDLLAGAAAAVEGAGAKIAGGEFDFDRRYAEQQQKFPASAIRAIPRPTSQEARAALSSAPALVPGGESPGDAYRRNLGAIEADEAQLREAHPIASGAGEISGDIATLITGRAPIANLVRRAEQRLVPRAPDMFFAEVPGALEPGVRRTVDRALKSDASRRLARGAGRSVETGLEAAILEVVKGEDSDPLEAAAFAAGGQVVGSALLEGGRGLLSGGPLKAGAKISIAAASIAGMWQLGKSATPGGRDRILESIETGYSKVTYGLMLGAAAAMTGAGRGRGGQLAEDLPQVVDAIAAVPRGLSLSVITDIAKMDEQEQARVEAALNGLARNPEYEGKGDVERRVVERIRSAMEGEK